MQKISRTAIKKAILAVEAERSRHPAKARPDRAQHALLQKNQRASGTMVSRLLKEAGVDMQKFQELRQERIVELERIVANHKMDALLTASQHKDTLRSSIVGQSKALRDLVSQSGIFPYPSFNLDTPILIWSIPSPQIVSDSAAVPFGSWAKFTFSTSQSDGTQKVGFYFDWVNPFSDYAVISAATFMSAIGYLTANAPWGLSSSAAWVQAATMLNLWYGWPNDVTSSSSDTEFLEGARAFSEFILGGDTEGSSISSGVSMSTTMFAVPPGALVLFEVAIAILYDNEGGNIEADFETGDFKIACPVVVFSLLNSPPGMMT
jgi:hypothetical protein